jgi:hypothetical protein
MAKDVFHKNVLNALLNDGWTITHDPLTINIYQPGMDIDLGAEKIIAAEKGLEKIAVEVKSFLGKSSGYEFHQAIGQYGNYRSALADQEADRVVYLAIPQAVFNDFFQAPFPQKRIHEEKVKILVFDPLTNTIQQWIH